MHHCLFFAMARTSPTYCFTWMIWYLLGLVNLSRVVSLTICVLSSRSKTLVSYSSSLGLMSSALQLVSSCPSSAMPTISSSKRAWRTASQPRRPLIPKGADFWWRTDPSCHRVPQSGRVLQHLTMTCPQYIRHGKLYILCGGRIKMSAAVNWFTAAGKNIRRG